MKNTLFASSRIFCSRRSAFSGITRSDDDTLIFLSSESSSLAAPN